MSRDLTEPEIRKVRQGIREKYDKVAAAGPGGCFRYPTGREGMEQLGYPPEVLRDFPPAILAAFCGVGNPFSLGPLYPGDAVLDIGCGAGVDSLVAAHLVGEGGRVVGVDVTAAMIETARGHLARLGWPQVRFEPADAEALPFPADDFDAVISNGVFNLTLDKEQALAEAHRVLKPGGRLMLADMVLVAALPPEKGDKVENWFQ
ncbi:MAG: methyltransferase domain-containing protein [Syntrophobacterales bacterium]|jgi:SAM-dependent methyltransferase|nr:methyltransferase domain-containing protein [Syntrophobacterales bacterium]